MTSAAINLSESFFYLGPFLEDFGHQPMFIALGSLLMPKNHLNRGGIQSERQTWHRDHWEGGGILAFRRDSVRLTATRTRKREREIPLCTCVYFKTQGRGPGSLFSCAV